MSGFFVEVSAIICLHSEGVQLSKNKKQKKLDFTLMNIMHLLEPQV